MRIYKNKENYNLSPLYGILVFSNNEKIKKYIMTYQDLNQFIEATSASKSRIIRFYNKYPDLKAETKMKGKKRMYPSDHTRYFNSEIMFDENQMLRMTNKSMRNLIDCLSDKDSLQFTFWNQEWSYFGTVAYKAERNKKGCFRQMHALFDHLIEKYEDTIIRLFFTTERFPSREGYHNHFVLYVGDKRLRDEVVGEIQEFFSYDRTEFAPYNRYEAGIFYMCKEGLVNEDWDFLYNRLDNTDAA
jgi:hypothetical protein